VALRWSKRLPSRRRIFGRRLQQQSFTSRNAATCPYNGQVELHRPLSPLLRTDASLGTPPGADTSVLSTVHSVLAGFGHPDVHGA
jgi:hypothetical protein